MSDTAKNLDNVSPATLLRMTAQIDNPVISPKNKKEKKSSFFNKVGSIFKKEAKDSDFILEEVKDEQYKKTLEYKFKLKDKYRKYLEKEMKKRENKNKLPAEIISRLMVEKELEEVPYYIFYAGLDTDWFLDACECYMDSGADSKKTISRSDFAELIGAENEEQLKEAREIYQKLVERDHYFRYIMMLFYTRRTPEITELAPSLGEAIDFENELVRKLNESLDEEESAS